MRIVENPIRENQHSEVYATDEPGAGGACHQYIVIGAGHDPFLDAGQYAVVNFQKGPVKENGKNGCHQEDLLAIVRDRLQGFQSGEYSCRENALALTKIEEAIHWLNQRTAGREKRGVEGTHEK